MHYHINTIYVLLVIVFAALVYLYVDEFTEKERHVLFVEVYSTNICSILVTS